MTDRKTIDVYIRLCKENREDCREITFRIPDGISQEEVLDRGYAIDGNEALRQVPDSDTAPALAEALRDEQYGLRAWLGEYGYEVTFR